MQVRLASNASQLAGSDEILKTFLLACESRNNKLSIMGLAGVDKLIAHNAVAPSVLPSILSTLKEVCNLLADYISYTSSHCLDTIICHNTSCV